MSVTYFALTVLSYSLTARFYLLVTGKPKATMDETVAAYSGWVSDSGQQSCVHWLVDKLFNKATEDLPDIAESRSSSASSGFELLPGPECLACSALCAGVFAGGGGGGGARDPHRR